MDVVSSKGSRVRLTQGIALLSGALFLAVVVAADPGRFYWTPLTLGIAYLTAAILGGRDGGHWATACALTGWGASVVVAGALQPDLDVAGLYLAGAGLGVLAGLVLQRSGFAVSSYALAGTITGAGVILALTAQAPGVLDDARVYGAAIGAVAIVNLVLAVK